MSDSKILLTYKDDEGNYQIESVWATKQGNYYEINNIPFFAPNIALGDVVSAEEDGGVLYFEELIKPSGHSTIQIIFFNEDDVKRVEKDLEKLGCTWEGSHIKTLIAVDIPKDVPYSTVKEYLDKGEKENRWSYKEACLSHEL